MTTAAGAPGRAPRRAWRSPLAWVVLIFVCATGVTADLGLKAWAFRSVASEPVVLDHDEIRRPYIPSHDPVVVIPRLLNLHLVGNEGAVFGIGANQRMFFIAFTIAALVSAVAVFGRWTKANATIAHIAIGLIIAGGLGNLYDRLYFGFVRDFLHMLPGWSLPFGLNWPGGNNEVFPWVFNVADVMLLFGMGTMMWYMNSLEKQRKLAADAAAATAPGGPAPRPAE